MQPFTVILGVILGSLVSIAFSLSAVTLIFWILRGDHPQFSAELPELTRAMGIFVVLALTGFAAFVATLRRTSWRYLPLALMWAGLGAAGFYYWPD